MEDLNLAFLMLLVMVLWITLALAPLSYLVLKEQRNFKDYLIAIVIAAIIISCSFLLPTKFTGLFLFMLPYILAVTSMSAVIVLGKKLHKLVKIILAPIIFVVVLTVSLKIVGLESYRDYGKDTVESNK